MRKITTLMVALLTTLCVLAEEKQETLNWRRMGNGETYQTLAPIANGDHPLLVDDKHIYARGYGEWGDNVIVKHFPNGVSKVKQIVSTQGNLQIGFEFVFLSDNGHVYGYNAKNDSCPMISSPDLGDVTALCYSGDHGLFCGTEKGQVFRYQQKGGTEAQSPSSTTYFWRDLEPSGVPDTMKIKSVRKIECAGDGCLAVCMSVIRRGDEKNIDSTILLGALTPENEYRWKYVTLNLGTLFDSIDSYGFCIPNIISSTTTSSSKPQLHFKSVNYTRDKLFFSILLNRCASTHDDIRRLREIYSQSGQLFNGDGRTWLLLPPDQFVGHKGGIFSYYSSDITNSDKGLFTSYDGELRSACYVDTLGTLYGINDQNRLVRSKPMPNVLAVDVKYVSPAARGDSDDYKSEAVYKVTITGAGLDRSQIFKEGLNGFKYMVSCEATGSKHTRYAYPLTGVRYIDTPLTPQAGMAVLNPRTISFMWKGPQKGRVTVEQQMDGKPFGSPVTVVLPSARDIKLPRKLSLKITKIDHAVAVNTGTCAIPFSIQLFGEGMEALPDTSEIYNRLVFHKAKGSSGGFDANAVVGADPMTDNVAILPNDCVELDGFVKFGTRDPYRNESGYGRHFYLFLTGDVEQEVFPAIVKDDGTVITAATSLKQSPHSTKLSVSGVALNDSNGINKIIEFNLTDNGKVDCSNLSEWSNQNGIYHGYLDFVLKSQGVFYLFPQGLSTDDLERRLQPNNLSVGFYCIPLEGNENTNPFWAEKYQMGAFTGMVEAIRNTNTHLIVFDRYGRHVDHIEHSGETPIFIDRIPCYATNGAPLPVIMSSSMRTCGSSKTYEGKNVQGKGFSGLPAPPAGLFMPPNMSEYITCYIDGPEILQPPFDDERARINFQVNTLLRCNYYLCQHSYLEIWNYGNMQAKARWEPGYICHRDYGSIVMGLKFESSKNKHVRLHGICVAFLPKDEVGRYNYNCVIKNSKFLTTLDSLCIRRGARIWVLNEGYGLKTYTGGLVDPYATRTDSYWVVPEVRENPKIAITPEVEKIIK